MLEGVGLTTDDLERISGIPFSEDQRSLLKLDAFVKSQRPFLEELMNNPSKLQICKAVIKLERFWNNRYIQRLIGKIPELKEHIRSFWRKLSRIQ